MPAPLTRQVYVISDMHLGGRHPDPKDPSDRGFRLFTHTNELATFITAVACKPATSPKTELVINGDLVDFLAEAHPRTGRWAPFQEDPEVAVAMFTEIAGREAP